MTFLLDSTIFQVRHVSNCSQWPLLKAHYLSCCNPQSTHARLGPPIRTVYLWLWSGLYFYSIWPMKVISAAVIMSVMGSRSSLQVGVERGGLFSHLPTFCLPYPLSSIPSPPSVALPPSLSPSPFSFSLPSSSLLSPFSLLIPPPSYFLHPLLSILSLSLSLSFSLSHVHKSPFTPTLHTVPDITGPDDHGHPPPGPNWAGTDMCTDS